MKIDLKSFKKLSSDKDSTTFQHRDGHCLTIAHKGLSPNTLKEMMALGGEARGVHKAPDSTQPGKSEAGHLVDEKNSYAAKQEHQRVRKENAKINPKLMAQGGDAAKSISEGFKKATGTEALTTKQPESDNPTPSNYTPDGTTQDNQELSKPQPAQATGYPGLAKGGKVQYYADQGDVQQDPQQVSTDQQQQPPPEPTASAPQFPAQATAGVQTPQTASDYVNEEHKAFENDLALGHIKPMTYQQYFGKQDTVGKIGTIFGLLVGGAGAGLTHQPNAAFNMIDNVIQRDMKAQQDSAQNAQNFLRLGQNNRTEQAHIANLNANTNEVNLANTYNRTSTAAFHNLVQQWQNMPASTPDQVARKQAYQQGLQNMYMQLKDKQLGLADAIQTYIPLSQQAPAQGGGGAPGKQSSGAQNNATQGPPGLTGSPNDTLTDQVGPILKPNAADLLSFYNPKRNPSEEPNWQEIQKEYVKTGQADKEMLNIKQALKDMDENAGYGVEGQQTIQNLVGHIPFVGQALEGATKAGLSSVPSVERYNKAEQNIRTSVRAVLPEVPENEIDNVMDKYKILPTDPYELRQEKVTDMLKWFKKMASNKLLKDRGLLNP